MTTPELEELLRDDAPRPSPAFLAEMEERLEAGFPRPRRLASVRGRLAVARLPRPAVAGLASVALGLSVTAALLVGGGDERGGEGAESPAAAPEPAPGASESAPLADEVTEAPVARDGGALTVAPSGPRGSGESIAPGERDRAIERSAQVTIAAPADELGRAAEEIIAVADRHRGFVLRSELSTGSDGGGGQFELRIPQERLRAALRDLSAIGEVRARSEQGEDVTPALSRTQERLEEARAERRGLLRRLERADSEEEANAIRRRLRLTSAEIRGLSRRLRAQRERVDYAAVAVTLEAGERSTEGGAGAAFDDALGTLEGAMELGIRALGVLLPLALLAAAGWLAARVLLRRRREAALG